MDIKDALICVQAKQYRLAANYLVKEGLRDKILGLTEKQRGKLTTFAAKTLRKNHQQALELNKGDSTPREIARQAYEDTVFELEVDKDSWIYLP